MMSLRLSIVALLLAVPALAARTPSPGDTTYHIDPERGDDAHAGRDADQPWKTFAPLNQLELAPGDRVEIGGPGAFHDSLELTGSGTAEKPITVHFAPGRYDFHPDRMFRDTFNISNTNGDPDGLKAVALLLREVRHARITGPGARIVCRGKMIEVCVDHSEHVTLEGLAFDYHRPTVSEFGVLKAAADHALIQVHPDSAYSIVDGRIVWQGEGWTFGEGLGQELDPATGRVHRMLAPLRGLTATELKPFHIRLDGKHRLKQDRIYQLRNPFRDCAGVFTRRSRDITWKDVKFHFLHGMGVVSQFSENLTFDSVSVAPDPESGRTTAAWADGFHFSGCRGKILVKDCVFSGAHDDAINIHGTYLRIVEKLSDRRIKVRFMHPQTFGFPAFNAGDEVGFVRSDSMATFGTNRVARAEMANPKELVLTLEQPVPEELGGEDVLENITWNPDVEIRGCRVSHIPTRGFLLTARGRVVVEDNEFIATHMSAIQIDADARSWFESGAVRDLMIRGNRFLNCGEPVIDIHPRNTAPNKAFHRNIRIEDNRFELRGKLAVGARGTSGLTVTGNTILGDPVPAPDSSIKTDDCEDVTIEDNEFLGIEE